MKAPCYGGLDSPPLLNQPLCGVPPIAEGDIPRMPYWIPQEHGHAADNVPTIFGTATGAPAHHEATCALRPS